MGFQNSLAKPVGKTHSQNRQGFEAGRQGADHAPLNSLFHVGIIKDKQGRFAPELHSGGHTIAGSTGIHFPATGHAACEGNLGQARVSTASQASAQYVMPYSSGSGVESHWHTLLVTVQ